MLNRFSFAERTRCFEVLQTFPSSFEIQNELFVAFANFGDNLVGYEAKSSVYVLQNNTFTLNPRNPREKIVTRSFDEGGVVNRTPPPSTFDTIHPIDLKFGTYNKLHLYFQLSETTWCLIGFHGNNSQINDVTGGRHLGFSNFQILFKFSLFYLILTGKQHLAVEIHEIGQIHCEIVSI